MIPFKKKKPVARFDGQIIISSYNIAIRIFLNFYKTNAEIGTKANVAY
jgi:hypothetical protein